jgi:GNAT superfamily N-acetyltransferase
MMEREPGTVWLMQKRDVEIRSLRASDYAGYLALIEELDVLHREALPHLFRAPTGPARTEDYFAGLLSDADTRLLGAERDGHLIGFVHAIHKSRDLRIEIQVPRRYVVVDNLVVAARHRRGGVARALLAAAHDWARERGVDTVEIGVHEFNEAARAFYEQCGYQTAILTLVRKI